MRHLRSYMIMHKVILGISHNVWGNNLLGRGLRISNKAMVIVENSNTLSEWNGGTLALMRGRCAVNMSNVVLLTSTTSRCFPCPFVLQEGRSPCRSSASLGCWAKGGDGLRLGWGRFAKQNVEKSLPHLLLFLSAKQESLTQGVLEQTFCKHLPFQDYTPSLQYSPYLKINMTSTW